MRRIRIIFIVVGLVGAFYLNGAINRAQASPGAASPICYPWEIYPYAGGCYQAGWNCDDGSGVWCEYCETWSYCIEW